MAGETIETVYRDFVTTGIPSSGFHEPRKPEIRNLLNAFLAQQTGANAGALIQTSKTALDALSPAANTMAWVIGDANPSLDGVYQRSGSSWVKRGALPYGVIRLNNDDAGTANAIEVTTAFGIPSAAFGALYILNVTQENTGAVTVSINGGTPKPLLSNADSPLLAGAISDGMALLCVDDGTNLRLLVPGDIEEIVAQAEALLAAAEALAGGAFNFNTRAAFEGATIPAPVQAVRTAGYAAAGDGGAALWKRISTPSPVESWHVESDDGAYWELSERVVYPEMFASNDDFGGDWRTAIERAAARLGSAGGIVRLLPGKDYNISGLDIPPMCVIQGPYAHIDTYADGVIYTGHGTFRNHKGLVLDEAGTISTYGAAGLVDCFVKRLGWSHTDVTSVDFAGIMMTSEAYAPILKNVMSIGFGTILKTGQHPRVFIEKLYGDASNGLDMDRSADVTRIRDVQLWPFGTIEGYVAGGAVDEESLIRSGTALKWRNGAAGSLVDGFFSLGYMIGMDIQTLSTLNAARLRFERPPTDNTGSIGLKIGTGVDGVRVDSLTLSGYEKGIQSIGTANSRTDIGYLECHLGAGTVLEVQSGDITIDEWYSWQRDGILVDVQNTASQVRVLSGYNRTSGGTISDYVKVPTNGRTDRIQVKMRTEQASGASLISGGPYVFPSSVDASGVIDLLPQADRCNVSSSETLLTINGGYTGRKIAIRFVTARQISNLGNIKSPLPFNVGAGEVIEFMHDGTNWRPLNGGDTFSVVLAQDTAFSFTPPQTSGVIEVFAEGSTTEIVEAFFRTTASPAMANKFLGAGATTGTGVLTGTTGTVSRTNVNAHSDGKIYIENRVAATRTIVIRVRSRP